MSRHLVGRRAEIDRLAAAVTRLDRGCTTLVEIVAEPGMGKSSLLAALGDRLGDRPVLRARATEFEQAVPCGVVAKALAGRSDRLLGQLTGPANGVPRHETYRAIRTLLGELAGRTGVALLLDDLHWADGDSLALLDYLLTTMPAAGMLVAVAYRPRPAPNRLISALSDVVAQHERIELGPLTPADSITLVDGAGQGRADAIVAASGGNPLYLLALAGATDTAADVPGRLRAALLSDVDSASTVAKHVARAAAVVGEPFDPDLVVEVAGLDRQASAAALDELRRRDVFRPEGTELRFRHPLLRRMIYDDAPPGWRRSAHRSAIAALRDRGASVLALAPHLELCAGSGDTQAIEVLLEAAELAGSRAPAGAARWLRGALALVPEFDATAAPWLGHHVRLARYLVLAGQFAQARDALDDVVGHLPPAPDPRRVTVVVLRATVERLLGNHNDGRRILLTELTMSTSDTWAYAELLLELSTVELMEGTFSARTVDLADQAARIGGRHRLLRTGAAAVAAAASYLIGDLDAAIRNCDNASRLVDALSDDELAGRLDACVWIGWAENSLERYPNAVAHFDRGIELAGHTGQAHLLCHLLVGRAIGQRWLGRLPAARRDADEAADIARLCRSDELLALAVCVRAWLTAFTDVAAARADAEAVVRLAGTDPGWWATMAGFVAATVEPDAGRLLTVGGGADLPRVDPLGRPAWYEELARAGGPRVAEWAQRAAAAADGRLPVGVGLAELAAAAADPADPAPARRAIELFTAAGTPLETARATVALADCLAGQEARRLLGAAEAVFERCGAMRLRDAARLRLAALA